MGAPGMLLLNVLLSLLGWLIAYPRRSRKLGGALVVLHLLASASTLPNSPLLYPANGCAVAPQHARLRELSHRSQRPVRPPTAPGAHLWALGGAVRWARAERPRRVDAKERPLRRSGACPTPPMSPPLNICRRSLPSSPR